MEARVAGLATKPSAVEERVKKLSLTIQWHFTKGEDPNKLVELLIEFGYPYDTVYDACKIAEKALNMEILVPTTLY